MKLPYDPDVLTPLPIGLVVRLVDRARRQLTAELRFVDTELDDVSLLETWLGSRPGTITLPTPSAEPGDLLVKLARAEFWTFTVHGWRELAPVEVVFLGAGMQQEPHFDRPGRMKNLGVVASQGPASNVGEAPMPPLRAAAVELKILAGAVRRTIEVAELPDLGVDDRLRAFAEGIEAAARIVTELDR